MGWRGKRERERGVLERNDMIAFLHRRNALANRLDDAGALVAENDGESAFWVLAGECVRICDPPGVSVSNPSF